MVWFLPREDELNFKVRKLFDELLERIDRLENKLARLEERIAELEGSENFSFSTLQSLERDGREVSADLE